MRSTGTIDASFVVRDADNGAGRGAGHRAGLKAGAVVFIEVRERLGPSLYRIAIGSRLLVASSQAVLAPGALVKAEVGRSGNGFILRIVDAGSRSREALDALLLKLGMPRDEASRTALAALLGAGISPESAALGRVRRAALRAAAREDERGLVELAARMEAKGMAAEDESLDALADAGDGRSGAEGRSGGGDASEGEDRPKRRYSDGDLDRDFDLAIDAGNLPRELGLFLKALVCRSAGEGESIERQAAAGANDTLGLFNHSKAKDGGWILVPFRFALDSVAFSGSFRIQLPYVPGGFGRLEARFDASCGERTKIWRASLSFGGAAPPSLRLKAPDDGQLRQLALRFADFKAELAALGTNAALGASSPDDTAAGLDLDA